MSNTPNISLPLVQASQAQKHVTVNEALTLLDGTARLVLQSVSESVPPGSVSDGACFAVPANAANEWAGRGGEIAIRSNGGWVFVAAGAGWTAFVADQHSLAIFDGFGWRIGAVALSGGGAATRTGIREVDHVISPGATSGVAALIPANAMVIGITARVLSDVTGTLSSFRIGVSGADDRYGSAIGLTSGSWARGLSSAPVSYYSPTDIVLTGEGGDFAGGIVRVAAHVIELDVPAV